MVSEEKRKYMKEYCLNNKDKIAKQRKEYYLKNKEKIKEERKEYRDNYWKLPEVKARQKEYYKNNRDKILNRHKKYRDQPEIKARILAKTKEYYQKPEAKLRKNKNTINRRRNDKEFSIEIKLRNLFSQAFRRHTKNGKMYSCKKYGIDIKCIIKALSPLPKDIHNWRIHHIIPLHLFDLTNPKEVKIAFAPSNHLLIKLEGHKEVHSLISYPNKEKMVTYHVLSKGGKYVSTG